jgi:uncharacterized membrane protein YgaE (UPF0421/DUF939 family)
MPSPASRFSHTRVTLISSVRVTVAAVLSMLLARLLRLPEFYWAPISAIVILLSVANPLTAAWQRFAGTALGASLAALMATFLHPTWIIYGSGIFLCGMLCALLRIDGAYRFAAITMSIVLLIGHAASPWAVALHRFIEVSLGIAVALLVAEVWPAPAL